MKVRNLREYRELYFKNEKKGESKVKKIPKEVFLIGFIIMFLVSGIMYFKNEMDYRRLLKEKIKIEQEKKALEIKYQNKKKEMQLLLMKEGIEKFARENYNFLKPGEILVVPKENSEINNIKNN